MCIFTSILGGIGTAILGSVGSAVGGAVGGTIAGAAFTGAGLAATTSGLAIGIGATAVGLGAAGLVGGGLAIGNATKSSSSFAPTSVQQLQTQSAKSANAGTNPTTANRAGVAALGGIKTSSQGLGAAPTNKKELLGQ